MNAFLESFKKTFLDAGHPLKPGRRIYTACSGGPDSTALFLALYSLKDLLRIKPGIIHINHGLRGAASDRDEAFVRRLAARYHVPFLSGRIRIKEDEKGLSIEEWARMKRYELLCGLARKHRLSAVALGHNLDDQAETVLMRMLQGTGLKGLCGIRSSLRLQGILFVRPLLSFRRTEILSFLKDQKESFRLDQSNRSIRFLRNKIRLKVIPYLKKLVNPRVVEALARIPSSVVQDWDALEAMELQAWQGLNMRSGTRLVKIRKADVLALPAAVQFRLLNRALNSLTPESGINFESWSRLGPRLKNDRFRMSLPKNVDLSVESGWIKLKAPPRAARA